MLENNKVVLFAGNHPAIEHADLSPKTKQKYQKELQKAYVAGVDITDPEDLSEYASGLPVSSRSFLKAAIRLVTSSTARQAKAVATPDNIDKVQAVLWRLDAANDAIQTTASRNSKAHNWLTPAQVKELMATCGDDLEGIRDWIVLGLMLGAGLRRDEVEHIEFSALKTVPSRHNGPRDVLQVTGKGALKRVIPISKDLADKLRQWGDMIGASGRICRALGRKKELADSISGVALFKIVRKHGKLIGLDELDPHDLRRSFAQLGYGAGVPITQLSTLLGHSSIATTQKYLDLHLDLDITASDFVPLT